MITALYGDALGFSSYPYGWHSKPYTTKGIIMSIEPIWIKSYEQGVPVSVDTVDHLLSDELAATANRFPGRPALHLILKYLPLGLAIQSRMTFRELDLASNRLAHVLQDLGLQAGERVAIMLPNIPQQVVSLFGISKAGCVVVNTNPIYTAPELQHQFKDSNAKAVICMSGGVNTIRSIQNETEIEHIIVTDINSSLPGLSKKLAAKSLRQLGHIADVVYGNGLYNWDALMSQQSAAALAATASPDDPAVMQYTGGTTGLPKAAVLTHRSLLTNVSMTQSWIPTLTEGMEVMMGALPFFHVFGMSIEVFLSIRIGARLVITPNPRDTEHNLKLVQNEKVTIFPGVPAMYNAIINHEKVQQYNMRSVQICISGGAPLPLTVQETFNRITGGQLVEGYGLTECSPVVAANPIKGRVKNGTIGVPFPGTEIRIVNLEADENGQFTDVEPGAEGELCVRGPHTMKEYWNRPEETAATLDADGWLHTGDIVTMDEDGYLTIVDRKKDLIIVSGYNVVPREVEEVLYQHDAILEAAVAGLPDPQRGEIVKAYLVTKPGQTLTEDAIREHCAQSLAPYKVPRAFAFKEELPKTLVGKILRRALVEEDMQNA